MHFAYTLLTAGTYAAFASRTTVTGWSTVHDARVTGVLKVLLSMIDPETPTAERSSGSRKPGALAQSPSGNVVFCHSSPRGEFGDTLVVESVGKAHRLDTGLEAGLIATWTSLEGIQPT